MKIKNRYKIPLFKKILFRIKKLKRIFNFFARLIYPKKYIYSNPGYFYAPYVPLIYTNYIFENDPMKEFVSMLEKQNITQQKGESDVV
jgi:hypothetical protein